ncbi:MAG TPA: hypothetical protein VM471_03370 [Phenylobacterium sp.]|nr:hypothetical protein [Phenylobacterium sp.]
MDMEDPVREAVIGELTRQAEASDGKLKAVKAGEGRLRVEGEIDLEALAMAIVGSLAGGP